jgi:serine/threonine protein kinase
MPTIGYVVAGKYELRGLLGRGSMGEVWVAHHKTLGEDVALKLLTSEPAAGEVENPRAAAARFRFEAQVAARLSRRTRHIVRVTDHGEEDGLAYLVMELLEGETLERRLLNQGPLGLSEAARLVRQVARALTEAHAAEVVHRDLKPANVFLTRDEDGGLLVKLLDFGIARTIHRHQVASFSTGRGLVFGTPGYMSPEQAYPLSRIDHRCDLWSLATVAYEALTGELPLAGTQTEELFRNLAVGRIIPVHERDAGLPAELATFFEQAFARKVEQRFTSSLDLARAFEEAVGARRVNQAEDLPAPHPGTLKGQTVSIPFPLLGPRRGQFVGKLTIDPEAASVGRRWPRWVAFAAPVALLLAVAAGAVEWRTHPGPGVQSATSTMMSGPPQTAGSVNSASPPPNSVFPPTGDPQPVLPASLAADEEPTTATVAPLREAGPSIVPPPRQGSPPASSVHLVQTPVRRGSPLPAPSASQCAIPPSVATPIQAPTLAPARPPNPPQVAKKPTNKSEVL